MLSLQHILGLPQGHMPSTHPQGSVKEASKLEAERPQLTFFNVKGQLLPDICDLHPASKGEPSLPVKESHFSLTNQSLWLYSWTVDWPVNQEIWWVLSSPLQSCTASTLLLTRHQTACWFHTASKLRTQDTWTASLGEVTYSQPNPKGAIHHFPFCRPPWPLTWKP